MKRRNFKARWCRRVPKRVRRISPRWSLWMAMVKPKRWAVVFAWRKVFGAQERAQRDLWRSLDEVRDTLNKIMDTVALRPVG